MNKKILFIILGIVLVSAIVIGLAFGAFFGILNKEKVSITASDFRNLMEEEGFLISDATEQFSDYDYVEQVYVAAARDYSYKIEFYELSDNSSATHFYNTNKNIFQASKANSYSESNKSLKNYSKYTLNSNGKFQVVSRIDNTVVYLNVDSSYKDNVNELLKKIGY